MNPLYKNPGSVPAQEGLSEYQTGIYNRYGQVPVMGFFVLPELPVLFEFF